MKLILKKLDVTFLDYRGRVNLTITAESIEELKECFWKEIYGVICDPSDKPIEPEEYEVRQERLTAKLWEESKSEIEDYLFQTPIISYY